MILEITVLSLTKISPIYFILTCPDLFAPLLVLYFSHKRWVVFFVAWLITVMIITNLKTSIIFIDSQTFNFCMGSFEISLQMYMTFISINLAVRGAIGQLNYWILEFLYTLSRMSVIWVHWTAAFSLSLLMVSFVLGPLFNPFITICQKATTWNIYYFRLFLNLRTLLNIIIFWHWLQYKFPLSCNVKTLMSKLFARLMWVEH